MRFVLDCSVTMAWVFTDEITPYTESVRDSLLNHDAISSFFWPLEVANVLLIAERKKTIFTNPS